MTESEWLAATDPTPMLEFLRGKASDRRLGLFACAGCRRRMGYNGTSPVMIASAEDYTDGLLTASDLRNVWLPHPTDDFPRPAWPEVPYEWATDLLDLLTNRRGSGWLASDCPPVTATIPLFRDIFGSPFRSIVVDAAWLTSDVVALAEGIYQDRAFDRLPILADALQDAGCDNEDVLNHCRGTGPHARGCFVVDLLLGKE